MEEAVILQNGIIVKKSFFDGSIFELGNDGRVRRFKYNNVYYINLFDVTPENKFFAYCDEIKFNLLKTKGQNNITNCTAISFSEQLLLQEAKVKLAVSGDKIVTYTTKYKKDNSSTTTVNETDVCRVNYSLIYNADNTNHKFPQNSKINLNLFTLDNEVCGIIQNDGIKQFMKNFSGAEYDQEVSELGEVLSDLIRNDSDFYSYLDGIGMLPVMESQIEYWSHASMSDNLFNNYSPQQMKQYKEWVVKYHLYFNYYRQKLTSSSTAAADKMFVAASFFDDVALRVLSAHEKLNVLTVVAKNKITDWWSSEFQGGSRENLVIRIINSVMPPQVDDFMEGLISKNKYSPDGKVTLFESLYKKMDDKGIGARNRKAMIVQLHKYWMISKYNPYIGDDFYESRMNQYTYDAKTPLSLSYESREWLGIYSSNFSLKIGGAEHVDKIVALKKRTEFYGEQVVEFWDPYGIYSFYQPVSLIDTSFDAVLRMPVIGTGSNQKVNNLIPAFFLMYVDSAADWESFKSSVGLFLDVILTFTGIGNLSKLRYLKYLSRLEQVTVFIGGVQILASTASLLLKMVTDDCNNSTDEFCKRIQTYLLWLELASGGADIVANTMLKRSANRLKEIEATDYPPGMNPEVKDMINAHALGYIEDLIAFTERVKYNLKVRIKNYSTGVSVKDQFTLIHSNTELNELIEHGYKTLKMTEREVEDLILISCRNKNPITKANLITQMDTWKNVIEIRGFPYKFNNMPEFTDFKNKFTAHLNSYGIISTDIRVQGSALRTAASRDLDIAIYITEEQLPETIKVLTERAKINYGGSAASENYLDYIKDLDKAIKKGKITSRQFGILSTSGNNSFMQEVYEIKKFYPKSESLNVSIIIKNSKMDVSPYIKF